MRIYLTGSRSLARSVAYALAYGHTVWCLETGEGWAKAHLDDTPGCSLREARPLAKLMAHHERTHTFFYDQDDEA